MTYMTYGTYEGSYGIYGNYGIQKKLASSSRPVGLPQATVFSLCLPKPIWVTAMPR
jgi:hypothetical protein